MSSFIPFISEILPMIMPASTRVVKARHIEPSYPTVDGPVIHRPAIVNTCDKMCTSIVTIRPKSDSTIRHNSEQDAIIYAVSGTGILVVNEGLEMKLKRHELGQGDFAFVPAWKEHQMKNESDEDLVWLVIQSGSQPIGLDLADWGGAEVQTRK